MSRRRTVVRPRTAFRLTALGILVLVASGSGAAAPAAEAPTAQPATKAGASASAAARQRPVRSAPRRTRHRRSAVADACGSLGKRRGPRPIARPGSRTAGCYRVGVAARSINPERDGTFAGQPVFLGGYGLGANPITGSRPATGILDDGIHVRAFSVSDGREHFAIADIETQGYFVATKDGPLGLVDMRKAVEQRTGGRLKAQEVLIQSDHTHSGPDTIGVWGGVPREYRRFIFRRTVAAIVEAFETERPGNLYYGTANGKKLLANQFDYDRQNKVLDSDVRVLQARDARGRTFATLLNFSAHTTVLGSSNTKVSGDWVQAANPLLRKRFGGEAVTMVGTLGRTQPADRGCPDDDRRADRDAQLGDEDVRSLCSIGAYARRVVRRAGRAVDNARRIGGSPIVAARSYLIKDTAVNAPILGFNLAGGPIGVDINRSLTPPWLTGNVVGTVTASARIGDVLLSSFPGEAYPQMPLTVRKLVPARGYLTAGLADDQLGYLIAPYEAYPEPVRRTFFNQRGDEVSPVDNDNFAFNVSPTMGERVICSSLRGAGEVFGRGLRYREAAGARCLPFATDLAMPAGADAR